MAMSLEEGVAKIEGILEQMDKRLSHMEGDMADLRDRFWWLIGIQISMWVTVILAIILT